MVTCHSSTPPSTKHNQNSQTFILNPKSIHKYRCHSPYPHHQQITNTPPQSSPSIHIIMIISLPPANPSISATTVHDTSSKSSPPSNNNTKPPVDFSPPLIAMVVVAAIALLVVTYSRLISRHLVPPLVRIFRRWKRWRCRRNRRFYLPSSNGDPLDSPRFYPSPFNHQIESFHVYTPYGLDDSVIKTIPLSVFTAKNKTTSKTSQDSRDCAVCLLEFEENDYVRTLPGCSHSFHVDCIDIWLRSHANCPLCRAGIFPTESPFVPIMAARIRPNLDESSLLQHLTASLESLSESQMATTTAASTNGSEITPCVDDVAVAINSENCNSEERFNGRDFLLKRSYSFGFERSLASERMVTEAVTASPWRYRRGSFWSRRPSPFGSLTKSRVFSFRHNRGIKSPFSRRRGFFPLSESSMRFTGSTRRSKSMTSPMFPRSSAAAIFSSSRLRCGDPEALLSPDRFNRR